jgi:hypothetical protein
MLKNFTVYLKDGGRFQLQCGGFTFKDAKFTINDSRNSPALDTYLLFDSVAAIIPDPEEETGGFIIYLKGKDTVSLKVVADQFGNTQEPSLRFYTFPQIEVKNVYIASSEVVAIIPAAGLGRNRLN